MNKLKICEFVSSMTCGGAENFVRILSKQAKRSGHDVTVLLLMEVDQDNLYMTKAISDLEQNGIRVESLRLKKEPLRWLRVMGRAIKFFRQERFDVIHNHSYREDILSALSRVVCRQKCRIISTIHSTVVYTKGLLPQLSIALHKQFIKSIFCGEMACLANKATHPNSTFISNGVELRVDSDAKCSTKANRDSVILLAVGRLDLPKAQIKLIEAMAEVRKVKSNVSLMICGEGKLRPLLEKGIAEHKLGDSVTLLGERTDVAELLCQADYFVSSSIYEGLPLAALEACAKAVPCLLSPIPPHVTLAEQFEGCLVASNESATSFAELVCRAIDEKLGQNIPIEQWQKEMAPYSIECCWNKYYQVMIDEQ